MVKEIVKSVKSVVKEIVKSVKSVVKVRSVEKACSGKNLKKRKEKSYLYIYFSLLSVIYLYIIIVKFLIKYNKLIAFIN